MAFFGLEGVVLANFIWLAICFCGVGIIFFVKYLNKKNWPLEVIIHHDMEGTNLLPITSIDRGRLISINKQGDKVLFLKRHKLPKPFSGKFVGRNRVAYAIWRNNWYNINYDGLTNSLQRIGLEPVDQYHRMMGDSIITIMDHQFPDNKPNKIIIYGVIIGIVLMALSGYILYKNMQVNKDTASINLEIEKQRREREETWGKIQLNITENIGRVVAYASQFSGGSGAIPA